MRATELLSELKARGVMLHARGDRLRVGPRERVTQELVAELRAHKAELIDLLTWPAECLQAEQEFGHLCARLFSLVDEQVSTPMGTGRLIEVLPERALVILDRRSDGLSVLLPAEVGPPGVIANDETLRSTVH